MKGGHNGKAPLRTMNTSPRSAPRKVTSQHTQRDSLRLKVADVRFVSCETHTVEERRILEDAFTFCKNQKVTDATWVKERDIDKLTQSQGERDLKVVYVVHPFSGPAFETLKSSGCHIFDPQCVVMCLEKNIGLPKYRGYPISSMALMHTEVCCSNLNSKDRDAVMAKVGGLGGNVTRALSMSATHLITPQTGSEKYVAAVKAGTINIVMPAWVEAVLKRAAANPGEDLSFDKELVKLYGVPIFSGLRISLTGITSMEIRKGYEMKIKSNGGLYLKMLERDKTTHLICDVASGEKYQAAMRWSIAVVRSGWIDACIDKGACLDVTPYLLDAARAATPEHVKQGPNGDRATSTPRKGAKQLDNSLNISAIPRASFRPPLPALPLPIRAEVEEVPEPDAQNLWRPEVAVVEEPDKVMREVEAVAAREPIASPSSGSKSESAKKKKRENVKATEKTVEKAVNSNPDGPTTSAASTEVILTMNNVVVEKTTVAIRNLLIAKDEKVAGKESSTPAPSKQTEPISWKQRLKISVSSGAASVQQQLSLAERILAMKKPASAPVVSVEPGNSAAAKLPYAQPPSSTRESEAPLHVQKLEKKAKQAGNVVKGTRISPRQKRAQLCWSQAPRNPFDEADFEEEEDEVAQGEHSAEMAVQPPRSGVKRAVSVVDLTDDDEPQMPVKKPVAPKVVEEPPKVVPVMMFSGIQVAAEKQALMRCITHLGAQYLESVQFRPEITHLIVKYPVKNEKYLSCAAAGKWVLHPQYLEDSAHAGHFLPETMYEWGNPEHAATLMPAMSDSDKTLAKCIYRWRMRILQTGQPAFHGWKVIVAADPKRMEGYVRLLEAGGAQVLASKSPYLLHVNEATHFLHEPSKIAVSDADLAKFESAGVDIRRVDFISTFLIDETLMPPLPSESRNKTKRTKRK